MAQNWPDAAARIAKSSASNPLATLNAFARRFSLVRNAAYAPSAAKGTSGDAALNPKKCATATANYSKVMGMHQAATMLMHSFGRAGRALPAVRGRVASQLR
jgi:hypothetical protein